MVAGALHLQMSSRGQCPRTIKGSFGVATRTRRRPSISKTLRITHIPAQVSQKLRPLRCSRLATCAAADSPAVHAPTGSNDNLDRPLEPHPELLRGTLENGLEYVIIPNKSPEGKFEAHLQMHVGSIHEKEDEQGAAHFVEHVTFLGSKKREALLYMGVRSNAYTDFHHTVFHMTGDSYSEDGGQSMLPDVIDGLSEIAFGAEFLRVRIEKERKAVLAEAQMMNTIEYRMDTQLLRYLHEENELGRLFPIGQVDQVKKWDRQKLYDFWQKWYFPANATLYIVGDLSGPVDVSSTVQLIEKYFASIPAGRNEDGSLKVRNLGVPPVEHLFGIDSYTPGKPPCKISMFRHPLVSNYILSVFSKIPVHPMSTLRHAQDQVIYRILVSTYARRINARYIDGDEQFHAIEYEIADSSRESSCVIALTITAEPRHWEQATLVAVQEAQRMVQHGVTESELIYYMNALTSASAQQAAAQDTMSHHNLLEITMESLKNGHTFNSNEQAHEALLEVAQSITLEQVHSFCRSFFSFLAFFGHEKELHEHSKAHPELYVPHGPVYTTSIVACVPTYVTPSGEAIQGGISARGGSSMSTGGHIDGSHIDIDSVQQPGVDNSDLEDGTMEIPEGSIKFDIDEEKIQGVLSTQHELDPIADAMAPECLITPEQVLELRAKYNPEFVPVVGREDEGPFPEADKEIGVVQRRLSNGATLNYKVSKNDPSTAIIRLSSSGGRGAEAKNGAGPAGVAAMQVGLRTISEGGTIGNFQRGEIEMFCLQSLISCFIDADHENNFMDWFCSSDEQGIRAVLQMMNLLITEPVWGESGFNRAKTTIVSNTRAVMKSMERNNRSRLVEAVFGTDRRFQEPSEEEVEALTMEGCRTLLEKFMRPDNLEVSVVGDFDPEVVEKAFLDYFGIIPRPQTPLPLPLPPIVYNKPASLSKRHIMWHLEDSDERGVGNIAGLAFRRWGDITGRGPLEQLQGNSVPLPPRSAAASKTDAALAQTLRRAHPLFAPMVLLFIQEIINSRLFVTVRDKLNLTYDVSFEIMQYDRLNSSWWCITVTASPPKVAAATQASLQVLRDCKASMPVNFSDVARTQSTLLSRHETELKDNQYLINLLTHLQASDVPLKNMASLRDMPDMIKSITHTDVNDAFAQFGLNDDEIYSAIATSGPSTPDPPPALKMNTYTDPTQYRANPGKGQDVASVTMRALAQALMHQVPGMSGADGKGNPNAKPNDSQS